MSNHQIKGNEVLMKKLTLKNEFWVIEGYDFDSENGFVMTNHSEHHIHSPDLRKSTANSVAQSKTMTGQHKEGRVEQAKISAIPRTNHSTLFGNDFGDHAKSNAGFENFLEKMNSGNSISSTGKTLEKLTAELKAVQAKQLAHATEKTQANFDNSVQGTMFNALLNPEPFFETAGSFVRSMTPQGIVNSAVGVATGYDYMEGTKTNRFFAGLNVAAPFTGPVEELTKSGISK